MASGIFMITAVIMNCGHKCNRCWFMPLVYLVPSHSSALDSWLSLGLRPKNSLVADIHCHSVHIISSYPASSSQPPPILILRSLECP